MADFFSKGQAPFWEGSRDLAQVQERLSSVVEAEADLQMGPVPRTLHKTAYHPREVLRIFHRNVPYINLGIPSKMLFEDDAQLIMKGWWRGGIYLPVLLSVSVTGTARRKDRKD
jgi:hypothetical protein